MLLPANELTTEDVRVPVTSKEDKVWGVEKMNESQTAKT